MINKFDGMDWIISNGQRPFRYDVEFNFPKDLLVKLGIFCNYGFSFLCKEARLPDIRINQTQVGVFGRSIAIPSTREFKNTVQLSFYIDESSFSRRAFEYWALFCDSSGYGFENDPPKVGEATVGRAAGLVDTAIGAVVSTEGPKQKTGNYTKGEMVVPVYQMKGQYTAEMKVTCQTYGGLEDRFWIFYDVYPISMTTSNFDDSATDRIMDFTVELAYSTFFCGKGL